MTRGTGARSGEPALTLDRRRVLAYRVTGHGLAARRPAAALVDAVGAIGLRHTKHAALSVAARLDGVSAAHLADALEDERLVAFYGARGTVMMAPARDFGVFTLGVAPVGEASLRAALPGAFVRHLDRAGMTASDALAWVTGAVRDALAAGPRPRGETAQAVTRAVRGPLTPPCRGRCPDPHVEDSLFRLAGVNGAMRFHRGDDVLVGVEAGSLPPADECRAEFVRRYLRGHGPSPAAALAAWAGVSVADARRSLDGLGGELVGVEVDGRDGGVLLRADAHRAAGADVEGVRFLPPFDPLLLDRDRALLVPSREGQKAVWRAAGNPGVVVVDGEPVAIWRTRKGEPAVVPLDGARRVDPALLADEARRLTAAGT